MQFLLYIALYESKCILVGVALRPPPVADKGSKALSEITSKKAVHLCTTHCDYISDGRILSALRHERGTVTYRTNKNVDIYCTFVLKYKMKKCVERKR